MLARFLKDRRGGVAPLLAIAALPLMGSVGAAVDYTRASALRTAMQAALDSTVLTIAKQYAAGTQISGEEQQIFNATFVRPEVQNLTFAAATANANGGTSINLSASGLVKTTFMGVLGISTINIDAHAVAFSKNDGLGCVMSLSSTANGAISVGGSATVSLNSCSLYGNSRSATALSVGGSASLSALSIAVVGGASISGSSIATVEGIRTGASPAVDPYRDVAIPSFSGCKQTSYKVKTAVTIDPGVYCDGISINAGASLTLNPGIYYLDRGDLSVNGGATISGKGVTLVFTSSTGIDWATATINGNATVDLTAPIAGPTAGIVILGDRQMPTGTSFKFNGGSTQYLGGAVYLPTGAVDYSGGMGASTNCTQIIGNTVTFSGNSNVAINCSSYKVRPFSSTILRLTS